MGYQYKVIIADVEHGMSDIQSVKIDAPLFDTLSAGNACSAEMEIVFWPLGEVPKMAKLVPYVQKENGEWLKLGEFFTDTRAKVGSALRIVAYDRMMMGDVEWVPSQNLVFPMTMPDAVSVIADAMGAEIDDRTVLNPSYTVDYPANEVSMRDVLGYIGAAHAGNWIITRDGKLLLVPLFASAPEETFNLVTDDGDAITLGGVRIRI